MLQKPPATIEQLPLATLLTPHLCVESAPEPTSYKEPPPNKLPKSSTVIFNNSVVFVIKSWLKNKFLCPKPSP